MRHNLTNCFAALLSALWEADALPMPIASGHEGVEIQGMLIKILLLSVSVTVALVCIFVLRGLRTSYSRKLQADSHYQSAQQPVPAD